MVGPSANATLYLQTKTERPLQVYVCACGEPASSFRIPRSSDLKGGILCLLGSSSVIPQTRTI